MSEKEVGRFGVGLAKIAYPFLKIVGSKDSVAIRGDGKVFVNEAEEKMTVVVLGTGEKQSLVNNVIGVGFETRTNKVFFTLNGREVYTATSASKVFENCTPSMIYPTFSMGSLDDKI